MHTMYILPKIRKSLHKLLKVGVRLADLRFY
jgi:hypothetical protein